jgi:hypothetical protein
MGLDDEVTAQRSLQDLEGQRRVQRSKFATHLAKIFFGVFVLGGLMVGIALGGAFKTKGTTASSSSIAVGVLELALAIGLLACLHAYLLYRHRIRHLVDEPFGKPLLQHDSSIAQGVGDSVERFKAEGQLQSKSAVPAAGERADDDLTTPDPYDPLGDVDVLGAKSGATRDGVNRTTDPLRGPIE